MLDSARLAMEHVASGGPDWQQDQKTIDAASKRVEEVSEQAKKVSRERQAVIDGIPWQQVTSMRDRLAHDYGRLDVDLLADVTKNDLPALIRAIETALGANADEAEVPRIT